MKKDFYSVLGLSLFFLILCSLRLGPQAVAWRRLAFYLIHPTAGSFLAAHKQIDYLGDAWKDLFESRRELEDLRAEYKRLQMRNLEEGVRKEEQQTLGRMADVGSKAQGDFQGLKFQSHHVVYRGIGEKMWSTMACVRGGSGWPEDQPVLQFDSKISKFTLAGKTMPLASRFGSFPCVELITSESFAVAVQVASTGESAVIRGLGRPDKVSLEYLPKDSNLKVGDIVVTNPLSLFVPAGIAVGEVVEIESPSPAKIFLTAYVKPYMDTGKLMELVVISK